MEAIKRKQFVTLFIFLVDDDFNYQLCRRNHLCGHSNKSYKQYFSIVLFIMM